MIVTTTVIINNCAITSCRTQLMLQPIKAVAVLSPAAGMAPETEETRPEYLLNKTMRKLMMIT